MTPVITAVYQRQPGTNPIRYLHPALPRWDHGLQHQRATVITCPYPTMMSSSGYETVYLSKKKEISIIHICNLTDIALWININLFKLNKSKYISLFSYLLLSLFKVLFRIVTLNLPYFDVSEIDVTGSASRRPFSVIGLSDTPNFISVIYFIIYWNITAAR